MFTRQYQASEGIFGFVWTYSGFSNAVTEKQCFTDVGEGSINRDESVPGVASEDWTFPQCL